LSGLRIYRIPFSTNVERVALALAHKGVGVEWIDVDPDDRSEVVRVSGQELVPVVEHDGQVLTDSPVILEYLEERYPERPLLPADPARRAEVRVFCAWFNRVWKLAPNAIVAEEARPRPDAARIAALAEELRGTRDLFDDLLTGRDFLFDELSLADVTAFPFLKYAVLWQEGDPDRFHEVLREWLALDGAYPRLEAWIHRLDALPRA
jgi:glutathione S-transferase